MDTVQGEFGSKVQAKRAVEGLISAGVPSAHIRLWNIIPESVPSKPGTDARNAGAVAGGLLAGVRGFLAGAIAGRVLDSVAAEGPHLPDPTGVRVVVDVVPSGPDLAGILRNLGAANVH